MRILMLVVLSVVCYSLSDSSYSKADGGCKTKFALLYPVTGDTESGSDFGANGTYDPAVVGDGPIYVDVVDSNAKIVWTGEATLVPMADSWVIKGNNVPKTNPAFVYAYYGLVGSYTVTSSAKIIVE